MLCRHEIHSSSSTHQQLFQNRDHSETQIRTCESGHPDDVMLQPSMTDCLIRDRVFHLKIGLQEVIQSGWSAPRASVFPRECCCKCPEKRGLIATFALLVTRIAAVHVGTAAAAHSVAALIGWHAACSSERLQSRLCSQCHGVTILASTRDAISVLLPQREDGEMIHSPSICSVVGECVSTGKVNTSCSLEAS